MCEALEELFKDEIEKKIELAVQQGYAKGYMQGYTIGYTLMQTILLPTKSPRQNLPTTQIVENLMTELNIDEETAKKLTTLYV